MDEKTGENKNAIKDDSVFISYFGTVYRFPLDMMNDLGKQPHILNARIERALQKGLMEMDSAGGYGCWYCRHYIIPPDMPGQEKSRCGYKGDPNIKLAAPSAHTNTGRVFIIQMEPCIVEEAYIEMLAEGGLLKPYEIDGVFVFPKRKQIEELLSFEETSEVRKAAGRAEGGNCKGIGALVRGLFP